MTVSGAVAPPAALTGWSGALAVLEPRLAAALGPMVRIIEDLVRRGDTAAAPTGEMDGYGGLTRRGDPSRLLVSQWALAQEAPLEFLRRATAAELLYLEPNLRDDRPRGRVAVLVDSGPEQVGAGRLVQLATLIALMGRAERRGSELQVGVLGTPPGEWVTGRARELLEHWLRSRRTEVADPAEIVRWTEPLAGADETWVLGGPRLAAGLLGRRRLVVASECAWTADGASAVEALVDGHRVELALPHGDVAVQALRGAVVRRTPSEREPTTARGPFAFTGAAPTLIARGEHPSTLVRLEVRPDARPKVVRFGGRIVTAAVLGRRVVALTERDGTVRVEASGKRLGRTADIAIPSAGVPTASDEHTEGFAPLVYDSGTLLARLGGKWFAMRPDHLERMDSVLAARSGDKTDEPVVARRDGSGVYVRGRLLSLRDSVPDEVVLGGGHHVAWSVEPRHWRVGRGRETVLDEGETLLGLHEVDGAPALVVLSASGLILRLRWPAGQRTLTAWSGGVGRPSVHPTLPWVAVQRDGGVEVGDLDSGETVLRTAAS